MTFFALVWDYVFNFLKVGLISLAIILPVRYFLIQPFYVRGASMVPNFYDREYLIINEIVYRLEEPQRGEVIVFKCGMPSCGPTHNDYLIKRIIGLPGEKIKISASKITIYNQRYPQGFVLNESAYLPEGNSNSRMIGELTVLLADNEYFVLGDNRASSFDSKSFGPIGRGFIIGRVWLRGWPINRMTKFEAPNYSIAAD